MDRRKFVGAAGLAGAAGLLNACGKQNLPQAGCDGQAPTEFFDWKMVTSWPRDFPGLGTGVNKLAKSIGELSNGRLKIKVYGGNELVPPFEVFDAVQQGTAEMGHSATYYWKGKAPAAQFFTGIPFGMTAQELHGWIYHGGGLELWREVYAPHGLIPFLAGSSGPQMGGWFNREINSHADLKGLKMRIPGLGGEILRRAGGTPTNIPGAELFTALQTGTIDASEWVGPYNDLAFGLFRAAKYYYYPGWHEPGAMLELIVNKDSFDALPPDLQAIVTYAARAASQDMLDEFTARNNAALQALINEHGVQLRRLPDDVLLALYQGTQKVLEKLVADDPMAAKVYESYQRFYDGVRDYHHISEQAFINARDKVIDAQAE